MTRGWSAEADKLLDYLVRLFGDPAVIHDLTYLTTGERNL